MGSLSGRGSDDAVTGPGRSSPLIGVTTSEVRRGRAGHAAARGRASAATRWRSGCPTCGRRGGRGLPVVMPPLDDDVIEPLLDRLDGICLSGGPDLDPDAYGAEPASPNSARPSPTSTASSSRSPARADAREMPILAICRGTQALNVVRGGTLHQHLPEHLRGAIAHRQTPPGDQTSHTRQIDPAARLAAASARAEIERQLLPPPGDRSARPRACAVTAWRSGRHDRGGRGPFPALPDRRPVARRDAGRPARGAGPVPHASSRPAATTAPPGRGEDVA